MGTTIKATTTPTSTPTLTPEFAPKEKDSDGDGVPDEYDYAPKDPPVQTKEDVKTPRFSAIFVIGSVLTVVWGLRRKR